MVSCMLGDSDDLVFDLYKCGFANDLTSLEQVLEDLGDRATTPEGESSHKLLRVDFTVR